MPSSKESARLASGWETHPFKTKPCLRLQRGDTDRAGGCEDLQGRRQARTPLTAARAVPRCVLGIGFSVPILNQFPGIPATNPANGDRDVALRAPHSATGERNLPRAAAQAKLPLFVPVPIAARTLLCFYVTASPKGESLPARGGTAQRQRWEEKRPRGSVLPRAAPCCPVPSLWLLPWEPAPLLRRPGTRQARWRGAAGAPRDLPKPTPPGSPCPCPCPCPGRVPAAVPAQRLGTPRARPAPFVRRPPLCSRRPNGSAAPRHVTPLCRGREQARGGSGPGPGSGPSGTSLAPLPPRSLFCPFFSFYFFFFLFRFRFLFLCF